MKYFAALSYSIFIFIIAFFNTNPLKAQVTTFKMSDYKYRTDGLKAMSVGGIAQSSITNINKTSSFFLTPSSVFTKQYSKENKQLNYWNWTNLQIAKSPDKENPIGWGLNSNSDWQIRQYKGLNFIEYGSNTGVGTVYDEVFKDSKITYGIHLNPSVGIGNGRLEYISNAQMALFILEDLKEAGKIKGTVSAELANQFANLVTQLYNTRVFDFRKRRNYEVAKIDSFLRVNKIISSTDVQTYNIIADNWNYAIQPTALESTFAHSGTLQIPDDNRLTDRINQYGVFGQPRRFEGFRKTVSLYLPSSIDNYANNMISNDNILVQIDSTYKNHIQRNLGITVSALLEKHHAISLQRQRNYTAYANFSNAYYHLVSQFNTGRPDSTLSKINSGFAIGATHSYQYFPNSRTVFTNYSYLQYSRAYGSINKIDIAGINQFAISTSLNASYFLSYKSRISGNANLTMNYGSIGNNISFNIYISYVNYLF